MAYYLGIDLGGTNIAVGVIDENCQFISDYHTPTLPLRGFQAVVGDMADAALKALAKAGLHLSDLDYIGIGIPSSINPNNHHAVYANNLDWKDADVIGEFQKHIDIPVFLANDADAAALGEAIGGAAKDYDNMMMLTLGTGVGGSIVLNKKLFLGGDGYGCEPGHSTIVMEGRPCTCHRRGCLEAYASVTALIQDTKQAMDADPGSLMHEIAAEMGAINGRVAFAAAKRNDPAATTVIENYIHFLAIGISSFETLFRPQVIILGGGISNQGDCLLAPLKQVVSTMELAPGITPEIPIIQAQLGNNAGIIGAALLGRV